MNFKKSFLNLRSSTFLGLSVFSLSAVAQQDVPGIGAGISYPAPHQALIVNPVGLVDAQGMAASGAWRFGTNKPHVAAYGSQAGIGVGADFRQDPKIAGKTHNIFQAGAGIALGPLGAGATLRKRTGDNVDVDVAAHFSLALVKFTAILRSFEDKIGRMDLGLGVNLGLLQLSADFKKPLPAKDYKKTYFTDLAARVQLMRVTVGLGVNFNHYASGWEDTKLHAGASVAVTDKVAVDFEMHPLAQEWLTTRDTFLVGVRAKF